MPLLIGPRARARPVHCLTTLVFLILGHVLFSTISGAESISRLPRHSRHQLSHHQLVRRHRPHPPIRQRREFYFQSVNASLGENSPLEESGPWGMWSDLSECTRSCGGGVNYQTRACLETNRLDISHSCVGPSKRYFSCNVQECPDGAEDFRANQCSRFDRIPFEGRYYRWIPYTKASNPCELNCMPQGERFYYRHSRKVIDGTQCYTEDPNNICVDGVCVELGCDRVLGSKLREDKCRVCGGDGSTCRTVEGVYDQDTGLRAGYNDILLIPAGATNIKIRELEATNNYLAIRNMANYYYLNGDWHIQHPSTMEFAGTKFHYQRIRSAEPVGQANLPESLSAQGPTNEPLYVVLLYQEPHQGISYEYSVPFNVQQPQSGYPGAPLGAVATGYDQNGEPVKYAWIFGDYSTCSRSCGTGVQRRNVFCAAINARTGKQDAVQTGLCDPTTRPADTRPCSGNPCPASWQSTEWSDCSCVYLTQQRNVYCSPQPSNGDQSHEEGLVVLADSECGHLPHKPETTRRCTPDLASCPRWITTDFSQCDSKCGSGKQSRKVVCARKKVVASDESATTMIPEVKAEPDTAGASSLDSTTLMPDSATEVVTNAAVTDDPAVKEDSTTIAADVTTVNEAIMLVKKRHVQEAEFEGEEMVCDTLCDAELRPPEEQVCFENPCADSGNVEWVTSTWSSCETECGPQIQTRRVMCATRDGTVYPDSVCVDQRGAKPLDSQPCPATSCSKSVWFTSDWTECNVPCGTGVRTRNVFCGRASEGKVQCEPDENCDQEVKPITSEPCSEELCGKEIFTGPLGHCSLPCGGGQKSRSLFCFTQSPDNGEWTVGEDCDLDSSPVARSEQCNVDACDDDQVATVVTCKDTEFGCCPTDGSTPADEDLLNCPPLTQNTTCAESEFGCCGSVGEEEPVFALGPFGLGCQVNCNNTRFGCCPDGLTVANSSSQQECPPVPCPECDLTTTTTLAPTTTEPTTTELVPLVGLSLTNCSDGQEGSGDGLCAGAVKDCDKSSFGCCPDGWSEAQGPSGEGCEDGSGDSPFLSSTMASVGQVFTTLFDFVTDQPLFHDDAECSLTEFGCCPNGKKKATGPRYYGCTCHEYPFECCQDGFTPASGPSLEGCICSRMLYGCCADEVTPATGPDGQGCSCDSSTYGCCPDMVTAARGPNYAGCPCETLTFGCCPGSSVPAKGPDFGGCTCADTPFGCCADGVTVAYGPKFEGCPSGPSWDNKLESEVCGLSMEVGPCRNFTVKWFFDVAYGGCTPFWYGGCEGNGNRFLSQELCERACVKPEGPGRCSLPQIKGPCNSTQEAFHFSPQTRRCEPFMYGGCLGNTNRFETMESCEQHCIYQETALDMCDQPVSPGPCLGNFRRWHYRKEEGRCRDFTYGGCQGNLNNFQTEEECQNACASQTPFKICSLPKAVGPCLGQFPRWHFDSSAGVCREFVYSGCEGNKNRFVDRVSCENLCNQTVGPDFGRPPVSQVLPPTAHNEITDPYESVCALPKAVGPCRETIIQWYFDAAHQRCDRFYYGGCEGNANRFNDREHCEHSCLHSRRPVQQHDLCLEPKESGNCFDYRERWYYDVEDRRCHRFYYSGCGGNRNNFYSLDECSQRCEQPRESSSTTETNAIAVGQFQVEHCFKQFDSGPCQKNMIRWFYDGRDGVCKEFIYGGCEGNENRFDSQHECQTKCWNSQDICKLTPVRGSCSANFTQWYFDYSNNQCYEFQFSGCHGNANRFSSKEGCETQCKHEQPVGSSAPVPQPPQNIPDHCHQPRDPGPCRGYFQKWHFSAEENACQMFIFGGCGGNNNRFNTKDECESVCHPRRADVDDGPREGVDHPEVVCRQAVESGPCQDTQARWFYDPESHTCLPFAYGGCQGNKNRFREYEDCIKFCGGLAARDQFSAQPQYPYYPDYAQSGQPPQASSESPYPPPDYPYPSQPDYPPHSQHYPQPEPQPQQPGSEPQPYPAHGQPQPYPYHPQPDRQPDSHARPHQGPTPDFCEPMECQESNCILGIDYYQDSRGCPACRCVNPCYNYPCPSDMSCALELYRDEATGKPRAHAECRLRHKPGVCPRDMPRGEGDQCVIQCRSDADCRQMDKCCNNGCADVCVAAESGLSGQTGPVRHPPPGQPEQAHYYNYSSAEGHVVRTEDQHVYHTENQASRGGNDVGGDDLYETSEDGITFEQYNPAHQTANYSARVEPAQSDNRIAAQSGQDILVRCPVAGEESSQDTLPIWSKDGQQISAVLPPERFQILTNQSLLIRAVDLNDRGTYACSVPVASPASADGPQQTNTGYVQMEVQVAASIMPGPRKVIAQVGLSSYLQCNAIGYPYPKVTWWRGDRMLPLNSIKYLQMQNFTLLIRKVGGQDSGIYTCHAFNGIGPVALWDVTLLLDNKSQEPEIVPYDPSLMSNSTETGHAGQSGPHSPMWPPSGQPERISAVIQLQPQDYRVGSTLLINCVVRSESTGQVVFVPNVVWYVNSDIPLLVDSTNHHHYHILPNNTLVVHDLAKSDSGEYRCRASTGPHSDAMAFVNVQVESIYVPPDCQDSSVFANCETIVRANYCRNPYYNKFCCRSCYIAEMTSVQSSRA